jgi:hypothetical protein
MKLSSNLVVTAATKIENHVQKYDIYWDPRINTVVPNTKDSHTKEHKPLEW